MAGGINVTRAKISANIEEYKFALLKASPASDIIISAVLHLKRENFGNIFFMIIEAAVACNAIDITASITKIIIKAESVL